MWITALGWWGWARLAGRDPAGLGEPGAAGLGAAGLGEPGAAGLARQTRTPAQTVAASTAASRAAGTARRRRRHRRGRTAQVMMPSGLSAVPGSHGSGD